MSQDGRAAGRTAPEGIALRDEVAFVTGLVVGVVQSVVDVVVFFATLGDWTYGETLFRVAVVGVPVAIVVLIVCGAVTRRFQKHLVMVGAVLLVSPFVGAVASALDLGF